MEKLSRKAILLISLLLALPWIIMVWTTNASSFEAQMLYYGELEGRQQQLHIENNHLEEQIQGLQALKATNSLEWQELEREQEVLWEELFK